MSEISDTTLGIHPIFLAGPKTHVDVPMSTAPEGGLRFSPLILLSSGRMTFCGLDAAAEAVPTSLQSAEEGGENAGGARQRIIRTLGAASLFPPDLLDLHVPLPVRSLVRDVGLADFLREAGRVHAIRPARLVVEVSNPPPETRPGCFAAVERLRSAGIRVALELTGGIQAEALLEIRPDYLRIGGPFLPRGPSDFFRLALLDVVCDLAWKFGAAVVVSGVGTDEELSILRCRDVRLAQGPFFSKPLAPRKLLEPDFLGRFPFPSPLVAGEGGAPTGLP